MKTYKVSVDIEVVVDDEFSTQEAEDVICDALDEVRNSSSIDDMAIIGIVTQGEE
jgi:hypothetical protein